MDITNIISISRSLLRMSHRSGSLQHPTADDRRLRPWPSLRPRAAPTLSVRAPEFRQRTVTIVEVPALFPFGDTSILTVYRKLDTLSVDRTNRKHMSWCESYTSLSDKALTQSDKNKLREYIFSAFLRHNTLPGYTGDSTPSP